MYGTIFLITYLQKWKNTIECLVWLRVCFSKKCVFYLLSTSSRTHNLKKKKLQQYHSKLLFENWKHLLKCSQNTVFKYFKLRIVTQIFFVKLSYQTFCFRAHSFQYLNIERYCLNSPTKQALSICLRIRFPIIGVFHWLFDYNHNFMRDFY